MKKYNLPVILLKGLVLLPNNSLKLEFDSKNIDNNVIDMSLLFHDGYILVVSEYDQKTKPKIGVLSKIENNIILPNNNTRVDIKGLRRVEIIELMNVTEEKEPLESIAKDIEKTSVENENIIVNKIKKELKIYIKNVPYISNSGLNIIEKEQDLDKLIDLIAPTLNFTNMHLLDYLNEIDITKRSEMLLKDIYNEKESFNIERMLDIKIRKQIEDNQKEFILREKMKLIKQQLGEVSIKDEEITSLKERCNNLKCGKIKERVNKEIKKYETINSSSLELNVVRDYIENLLSLPYTQTEDNEDLKSIKKQLDESHYGLEEVKNRIIEYLAVKKTTKSLKGPILCLVGPPGVGKTSIANSIAKAMNRKFTKISLGGVSDEAEILGHRKTYVGAMPGRIITSIIKAKSNNPVFLIDEIDKMTNYKNTSNSLLNILDPKQNKYFSDNYIEEEYDLSNVLFILTANSLDNIDTPLKDRLEIIELSGYTEYQKLDIANKYLIPKILKNNGLNNIDIKKEAILKIIRNYTKESGIRELERQLDKLIRKIVTQIVINNIKINKLIINESVIEKYLGNEIYQYNKPLENKIGIVNGLAYTNYGGDILPIEVNMCKGLGNLNLTGSLGEVMKESALIALDYLKANYKKYNINYDKFKNDFHIHVPQGAIKKEGPSAGIALTLSLYSLLTNKKIPSNIALTGEITLTGNVLPIGGLKEKCIGALRSGIKTIICPFDNQNDIKELPKEIKDNINFIKVKKFEEIVVFLNDRNVL